MLISILGCGGSRGRNSRTTAFLIDQKLLLDCGTATEILSSHECAQIDNILITHSHIDHLLNLPFFAELTFFLREKPVILHGTGDTLTDISSYLLNGKIWPDFSRIPNEKEAKLSYHVLNPLEKVKIAGYTVVPIPMNHTVPTVGYLIDDGDTAFAFAADTHLTELFWKKIRTVKRLKAVFVESSFPDELEDLAKTTGHLTPRLVVGELAKLNRKDVKVFVTHIKPTHRKAVVTQLINLPEKVSVLEDGMEIRL